MTVQDVFAQKTNSKQLCEEREVCYNETRGQRPRSKCHLRPLGSSTDWGRRAQNTYKISCPYLYPRESCCIVKHDNT